MCLRRCCERGGFVRDYRGMLRELYSWQFDISVGCVSVGYVLRGKLDDNTAPLARLASNKLFFLSMLNPHSSSYPEK